jgi:hypothetical protein
MNESTLREPLILVILAVGLMGASAGLAHFLGSRRSIWRPLMLGGAVATLLAGLLAIGWGLRGFLNGLTAEDGAIRAAEGTALAINALGVTGWALGIQAVLAFFSPVGGPAAAKRTTADVSDGK